MHTILDILNVLAAIGFFFWQRRTNRISKKVKAEAHAAIESWKKEVLRQLFISGDYRKQRNALRFQVEQAQARERRLASRVDRAEKLLNRVSMVHFTRRPPPSATCPVYLQSRIFSPQVVEPDTHAEIAEVVRPLLLKSGDKASV
jgi:cysteinyl-tRNA synthetase